MKKKNRKNYVTPVAELGSCEVWSRVCGASVVTNEHYYEIEDATIEKGTSYDISSTASGNAFNHTWEDGSDAL